MNRPAVELYGLLTDPWELNNLAGQKTYNRRIKTMRKALDSWMKQQGDKGALMDVAF